MVIIFHSPFSPFQNWHDAVGKIYRRLLQVHVHRQDLWVAAAKFELEERGNAESARKIMLEAIRFHKDSKMLYREVSEQHECGVWLWSNEVVLVITCVLGRGKYIP